MAQVPANRTGQGGRMTTQRENPLARLRQDFDTLLDRLWGGSVLPFDQDFASLRVWDFDVKEDDHEITVRAEIPGFQPNEVDVQINDNVLTIKAEEERKGDQQEEYRSFYRAVVLPAGVDAEHAQGSYNNGVLELHIPRLEGARPRHIKVEQQSSGQQQGAQQQGATAGQRSGAGTRGDGSDASRTASQTGSTQNPNKK